MAVVARLVAHAELDLDRVGAPAHEVGDRGEEDPGVVGVDQHAPCVDAAGQVGFGVPQHGLPAG